MSFLKAADMTNPNLYKRQQPYLGTVKQLEVNDIDRSLTCCRSAKKWSLAPGDTRNSSLNHKSKQVTLNQVRTTPYG